MEKINISKKELDKIIADVIIIIKKAGVYSLKYFGKPSTIKKKGKMDIVTEVDIKCEGMIKDYLTKKYPDFGFLGEEGSKDIKDYTWIVDPIDGTTNFAHGYRAYCVSIGLAYKGKAILGVIYAPVMNDLYTAHILSKSYKNGKVIKVSTTKKLIDSLVITGFYYNMLEDDKKLSLRIKEFENMSKYCQALRRDGSAALDMCYVAEGIADGFFEYGLSPWDVCAGTIILECAGGKVSGIDNKPYDIHSKLMMINSNNLVHKEIIKAVDIHK